MKKRLITGLVLIAVLVPLIIFDNLFAIFQVVAAFFVCVGAYEMLKLYSHDQKITWRVSVVIMLSTLLIYSGGMSFWANYRSEIAVNENFKLYFNVDAKVGIAFILFGFIMQFCLLVFSKSFDGRTIGHSLTTSVYIGFGVSSIVTLRIMGARMIVYLFLITSMTDVFAYVYGMLFGKHKMIERISPKKTWEGAIGGTIMATVVASIFAFMYNDLFPYASFNKGEFATIFSVFSAIDHLNPIAQLVIIVIVTFTASIISQIGDLVASRFKRTYDIKDFGNIFPGHGGFLDRFDSSILTSMFLVAMFALVNVIVV